MDNIEIEIQVSVKNIQDLLKFLKKKAKFKYQTRQVDRYFTPAHRNFTTAKPINEWLRLRNSEGKFSINYKCWHRDEQGKGQFCDEFETAIEDIEKMEKIFEVLDFKLVAEVDKTRQVWDFKNYEIAIDQVKGLGDFVEVEFKGKAKKEDAKKINDQMVAFLKEVGCKGIKRNYQGYPYRLLFPEEAIEEEL